MMIESMPRFAGITIYTLLDETTILNFRHLLEKHNLGEKLFNRINRYLEKQGLSFEEGTIMNASIIEAPSSTKNKNGRDPEMHQTKKGNKWHFGMKMHIGVDCVLVSSIALRPPRPMCMISPSAVNFYMVKNIKSAAVRATLAWISEKNTDTGKLLCDLHIIDKLHQWLVQSQPRQVGKTKLAEATNYLANQWPRLITYLEDGRLNIDNNRADRAIKPFVVGRKNWLFSQTAKGAQASANLYSIIETAKANGLTPFDYIMRCLDELCQPEPDIDSLLPWNIKT